MPLRRTLLITPATDEELVQKGRATDADALFLDLEDGVPSEQKQQARNSVIDVLTADSTDEKAITIRINGVMTPWWYDDLIEVVSGAPGAVDSIIVPKVSTPKQLHAVDLLLKQVEVNAGLTVGEIGIIAQLETVAAINNAISIARSTDRLSALLFGPGDYSASLGVRKTEAQAAEGPRWEYARSRIVNAAKEVQIQALDGLYPETEDVEGFRSSCQHARSLGFDGKTVVHPNQIRIANDVFTPSMQEIKRATDIYEAYTASAREEETVKVDGRIIDKETFEMAKAIVEKAAEAGKIDDV